MSTEAAHSIHMLLKSLKEQIMETVRIDLENSPSRSYFDDVQTYMRGIQIALAIGDAPGADIAGYLLRKRIAQQWQHTHVKSDVIHSELIQTWKDVRSEDGMEAWAAFYVGKFCIDCYQHREYSIYWLEKGFGLAKTSLLRFYTSKELSNAYRYMSISDSLKWCDKQKRAALELHNREYVCHALQDECRTTCLAGMFKEARLVVKKLRWMAQASPELTLYKVLSLSMHSLVAYTLHDFNESILASKSILKIKSAPMSMKDHVERYCQVEGKVTSPPSPLVISMMVLCMMEAWDGITLIHKQRGDEDGPSEIVSKQEFIELVSAYGRENHLAWSSMALREQVLLCMKNGKLKQAEAYAAQLLQISAGDRQHTSHALSLLARITRMHCPHKSLPPGNIKLIIDSLLVEAANLMPDGPERFIMLKQHADILFEGGMYVDAAALYEKCLETFFKVESSFPSFTEARISYLEGAKDVFRRVQNSLLLAGFKCEMWHALIWSERERARDLLYGMNKRLRARGYKTEMQAFDQSYDVACKEITSICSLVNSDLAFIVYTKFKSHFGPEDTIISYLLHLNSWGAVPLACHVTEVCPSLIQNFISTQAQQRSETLFNAVFPWEMELQNLSIKKIIIIPTEELSAFPFAALYNEEKKKYLIQQYAITILPSLRLFKQCEGRWEGFNILQSSKQALVVGNPTLNLKGAEKEAEFVHSRLKEMGFDPILLKGEKATPKEVMDILPATNWIHISSHAIVNKDCPHGALVLSPCIADCTSSLRNVDIPTLENKDIDRALEEFSRDANFFDGKLTGDLIEKARELKAKVAILSACDTGLGQVCAEGILGLCRSFHITGVPTVIVSLWKANDQSTQELMKRFYSNISDGTDLVVALQLAMISMVEEKDKFRKPKYKPRDWAAFVVSGTFSIRHSIRQGTGRRNVWFTPINPLMPHIKPKTKMWNEEEDENVRSRPSDGELEADRRRRGIHANQLFTFSLAVNKPLP